MIYSVVETSFRCWEHVFGFITTKSSVIQIVCRCASLNKVRKWWQIWLFFFFKIVSEYNCSKIYSLFHLISVKTSTMAKKSKNQRNWKPLTKSSLLALENMLSLSILWVTPCYVIIMCCARLRNLHSLILLFYLVFVSDLFWLWKTKKKKNRRCISTALKISKRQSVKHLWHPS